MSKIFKTKKAFTIVELIFVIVVLGIVASMGADTIVQVFKNTVPQKATNVASTKAELAVQQVANRLRYAVPWSLLARNAADGSNPEQLGDVGENDTDDKIIEWIGVDGDGFEATTPPAWSGYCDVASSTTTSCSTPGSDLGKLDTVIQSLGGVGTTDAIVIFDTSECSPGKQYQITNMGLTGDSSCAFPLTASSGTTLNYADSPKTRADKYDIAWSAYAIEPVNERDINGDGADDVFDLQLRYNYQPWQGDTYADAPSQIIATNVSVFKVAQNSLTKNDIRVKICIKQPIGGGSADFISMCKEKAVSR